MKTIPERNGRNERYRLSSAALAMQEEERRRIARDLHDSGPQVLTIVRMRLRDEVLDRAMLDDMLRTCEGELRGACTNLYPQVLQDLDLATAIRRHIKNLIGASPVRCIFRLHHIQGISEDACLHIFRIAQELAANAVKHSGADTIYVSMRRRGRFGLLRVADDGTGFELGRVRLSGLLHVEYRAALLHGRFRVEGGRLSGSRCVLTFPLEESS